MAAFRRIREKKLEFYSIDTRVGYPFDGKMDKDFTTKRPS